MNSIKYFFSLKITVLKFWQLNKTQYLVIIYNISLKNESKLSFEKSFFFFNMKQKTANIVSLNIITL